MKIEKLNFQNRTAFMGCSFFLFSILFSTFLFIPLSQASRYSLNVRDFTENKSMSSLEVISFNVGNMGDNPYNVARGQSCPNYKLCRPKSILGFKNWFSLVQPDVLFLQETRGIQQVIGNQFGGPLVDTKKYDAQCDYHACVVWKKSELKIPQSKEKNCRLQTDDYGDLVLCELEHRGMVIQLISAYYPAISYARFPRSTYLDRRRALAEYLFHEDKNFVSQKKPVIVGGDFNTNLCTFDPSCKLPYPASYYTLVGTHLRGYGQYKDELLGVAPAETFFGAYQADEAVTFYTHHYYFLKSQIDQLFANFGFPVEDPASDVSPYAGASCKAGLICDGVLGHDFDHYPIFARVAFKIEKHTAPTSPEELNKQVQKAKIGSADTVEPRVQATLKSKI